MPDNDVKGIIDILKQRYQDAPCALQYKKDYELMIAVRLSAQCTDARVNEVCKELFAKYPNAEAMAAAKLEEMNGVKAEIATRKTEISTSEENYTSAKENNNKSSFSTFIREGNGKMP
mgnify:CR=1 FL=1